MSKKENRDARLAGDGNAAFWDHHMGEGNDFFEELVWPTTEQLLDARPGERLLDIACGNGLASRRLAQAGSKVVAVDFSAAMIAAARKRSQGDIDYRILDATDYEALIELGESTFDGAVCSMALMDMAEVDPVMRATAKLLRPGGRFVFSILHPCFNNPAPVRIAECEDRDGEIVTTFAVKTARYLGAFTRLGLAIVGQPVAQPYFHRPLRLLLGSAFAAGFVLDALEERTFSPDNVSGRTPLAWDGRFNDIPIVLIARLQTPRR